MKLFKNYTAAGVALTAIWIFVFIAFCFIFLGQYTYPVFEKIPTKEQADSITAELLARWSGDCTLEPIYYGWKCTNPRTNQVFKVIREGD